MLLRLYKRGDKLGDKLTINTITMKNFIMITIACTHALFANSQNPLTTKEFIDVNNINAKMGSYGNLWEEDSTGSASCEFPRNSGKHIAFAGSLWMSGKVNGSYVAAAN